MKPTSLPRALPSAGARLDYLDATRAFALLLGVVFHASMSFVPFFMGWAVQDVSTSEEVAHFIQISHAFRMELFFLLAGFFNAGLVQRSGAVALLRTRAVRLGIPFALGWFLLRPLLISGWVMGAASLRGDYDFWAGIKEGFTSLRTLPAGIFTGSHLWFLYYLLLITTLALVVRGVLRWMLGRGAFWSRLERVVRRMMSSPWIGFMLIPPTALALWFMRFWGMDTPDQSLVPQLPVLAIYGGCFALGWCLTWRPEAMARFGRLSWPNALLAVVSAIAVTRLSEIQADPGHSYYSTAHVGFVASYATLMWTLVRLTLGVFQKILDRPRPGVRYLADASYWIYLVHLPIVVWFQVAVAEWTLPWWLKLAGISGATIGLSLVSYDLLVRGTWLGVLLNGRRRERILFRRSPAIAARTQTVSS